MRLFKPIFTIVVLLGLLVMLVQVPIATAQSPPSGSEQQLTPGRSPASPQPKTPKAALERLLTVKPIQAEWFSSTFLTQVSIGQVQQILTSLKTELGAYRSVQSEGTTYRVVFDRGFVPTQVALNQKGQIAGLFFQPPRLQLSRLSDAVAEFKTLPGQVSLLVMEGSVERAGLNVSTPLAVGSAFKLAVLEALKLQVGAGTRSWREVVELQPSWKSLPSGFLQTWADGSLLTVQSLAALMISLSDNTATDSLIQLVGRSAIEALTPRNRPFLTTREAFILKSRQNGDLLQQYRDGDEDKRRQLLIETVKRSLPDVSEFQATPVALDVEWFFSTQELCRFMEQVKDLPVMIINPGVAKSEDWQRVAFKGGSEPGVLNLTTALQTKKGKNYCVSATWNNNAVLEESRFVTLYSSLLELLN